MAGAIRTGPVTEAYEEGWERAFGEPRLEAVNSWAELARRFANGEGAGNREPRVSDPEGSTEPEAEQAVPRERETAATSPTPYSCPKCGWHLAYSSEKCGNATCPRGKTRYTTRD